MSNFRNALQPAIRPVYRDAVGVNNIPTALWDFAGVSDGGPVLTNTGADTNRTYTDNAGIWQQVPTAAFIRRQHHIDGVAVGLLRENEATNKCENFNANPPDLTGVTKSGDAAATLTVVDDTAELTAAGLQVLCSGLQVYKLDNSAGVANASATVTGQVTNLNPHSLSVFGRATAGTPVIELTGVASSSPISTATYDHAKLENVTPLGFTAQLNIRCPAGAVCFFILNQLEEGQEVTTPIIVAGAAVTRNADTITFDKNFYGYNNTLGAWDIDFRPLTAGAGAAGFGYLLYGSDTGGTSFVIRGQEPSAAIQPSLIVGDGVVASISNAGVAQSPGVQNNGLFTYNATRGRVDLSGTRGATATTGYIDADNFTAFEIGRGMNVTIASLAYFASYSP